MQNKREKSFIELNLNFYNDIFYRLTFFQIRKYTIEYSPEEKYYKKYGKEEGIEEIVLCEIGYEKGIIDNNVGFNCKKNIY